ncbi:MAG TPA: nucleotidyltransferase family protein [Desulfomonilaceae bacterium]|nr:nucleotidyltransferase family protein [Desulfomonilaceae bacterium]
MALNNFIQAKREEIMRIAARHGADNVRLLGSAARGEAGPSSDVDLLVEMRPNHSPWFPAGLKADLEELLGRRVHVVTSKALHPYIRERVLKEAVPLEG